MLQVALAEQEWEAEKNRTTAAHAAAVIAAAEHNEKIKPALETAMVASQELQRVTAFLAVVRTCAAKASLGVNYIPGAPNLDRVVEMATLTSALQAAYPELAEPAMESPLVQCDVVPWPQEAWTTKAPLGVSSDTAFRKTRAALAQIQAIQNGSRVPGAGRSASAGRKRTASAKCTGSRSPCQAQTSPSVGVSLNNESDEAAVVPCSVPGMNGAVRFVEEVVHGRADDQAMTGVTHGGLEASQGMFRNFSSTA